VKILESWMPTEEVWEDLFDVQSILDRFGMDQFSDVAELGCGYGTFSVAAAERISGTLYAFDIDSEMVARTLERGSAIAASL
jgi:predicted RNA methylase